MRKSTKVLGILIIMGLFLTACAKNNNQSMQEGHFVQAEDYPVEKNETEPTSTVALVEVSNKSTTVVYTGEKFTKSIFAVGNIVIYLCGIDENGNYFLGSMKKEESSFQKFSVDMGENMRAFNMTVDEQGKCHILWMSIEKVSIGDQIMDQITYEKSAITIVDSSGTIEETIDVSDIFAQGYQRPFCFVVDRKGTYFFENKDEIISFGKDGKLGDVISCDGQVEGIGVGKSGMVYCTYEDDNQECGLGMIEDNVFQSCGVQFPVSDALYSDIYAGTDSELLVFNAKSGVFVWDGTSVEARLSISDLPVKESEISSRGLLADGRLCIMDQSDGSTVFYYIPVGR